MLLSSCLHVGDRTSPTSASEVGAGTTSSEVPADLQVAPPVDGVPARIVRVVDGDTVVANVDGDDLRVRLLRIDTPELARDGDPAECLGDAAAARLEALVPTGTVLVLATDTEELDQFGRLLAHLWRAEDGLWVNGAMLASGFARVVTFPPNVAYDDEVRALERSARQRSLGLWATC